MIFLHSLFLLGVSLTHEAEVETVFKIILLSILLIIILESVDSRHKPCAYSLSSEPIWVRTPGYFRGLISLSLNLCRQSGLSSLFLNTKVEFNLV